MNSIPIKYNLFTLLIDSIKPQTLRVVGLLLCIEESSRKDSFVNDRTPEI